MSRSRRRTGTKSTHSTEPRRKPATKTTARRESGRSTARATTARSPSTPTATTSRRCSTIAELEPDAYEEIVRRVTSLRDATADLAAAYDDPVMKEGAEEMRESLERVLELLGRK